jgi:hypothetical protein
MIFFGRDFRFLSRGWDCFAAVRGTRRSCLGSSPLCFGKVLGFTQDVMTFRIGDLVKHLIHSLLNAGIRLMKFPGCLRGKLAKHIPVPQSMECVKYTIRAHVRSFSFKKNDLGYDPVVRPLRDGRVRLAKLQFGPDSKESTSKGFARITQIDAPPYPKVAHFLKEFHNAGGGSSGPAETALMS